MLQALRSPGSIITFGAYPQEAEGWDRAAIEWIVLDYDAEKNRALLLSRYGLEAKPFHTEKSAVTWETCSLRSWLNGEFLGNAFSPEEQGVILRTAVENSSAQGYSEWKAPGGGNTLDKIFLLSVAEAEGYFRVTRQDRNNTAARVAPTARAAAEGASASGSRTTEGLKAGWWWLRSPGSAGYRAASVRNDGTLVSTDADDTGGCVRPAFWISLQTGSEASDGSGTGTEEYRIPGNTVTFGSYPQTAAGMDRTAIEWIVLDYDAARNRVLLLSRYGLDAKPFHTDGSAVTWETSALRSWLNSEFLNRAFSPAEQKAILETTVDNSAGHGYGEWGTSGGQDTRDRVFLLSYTEAYNYLHVTRDNRTNTEARMAPTPFAVSQGASTGGSSKTGDGSQAGWWWLRSPGSSGNRAADVRNDGSLISTAADDGSGCIRPAVWLDLGSDIF